jgi:anti-sigma regulatory factor (Ser/Thr protein kinase)
MDDSQDHLTLRLTAEPENVRRARDEVASRAESLGLPPAGVDDLKTIVSEACANVVRHAYPEDAGERPMEVEMDKEDDELTLAIRDRGTGIRPPTGIRPSSLRLGFILIGSLADSMELRTGRQRGTELMMRVPLGRTC